VIVLTNVRYLCSRIVSLHIPFSPFHGNSEWWFYIDDDFFCFTHLVELFRGISFSCTFAISHNPHQTLASLFLLLWNEMVYVPNSLSANTHNTRREKMYKRWKQEAGKVYRSRRFERKSATEKAAEHKGEKENIYIFGRKVFSTKLLTNYKDKVEFRVRENYE
jgi:hypothetical protein